ncbi:MAG: DUF5709 domain-containing protein [Ornithinibacter sp.]
MAEQHENISDDLGDYSVDAEDQLQPEDTLEQDDVEDVLDRGFSPPDTDRGSRAHGVTAHEQGREETIEERIQQEVPDPSSAYGAPHNESGLDEPRVGGDDPDSIDAEDDWLGDGEVGNRRAGRLVSPDEGLSEDTEADLVGEDVGVDGAAASAEEAAVHVIDDDDDDRE